MPTSDTATTRATVVIERTFDAPRDLVWQAFTDPERVKQWWGPEGYHCPEATVDLRVGGVFRFAMRGSGGDTHWSGGVFREIVPPDRFVATLIFLDEHGKQLTAADPGMPEDWPDDALFSVTLADAPGGKTKLTMRQEGMPAEMVEGATAGSNSALDKLEALLR
jgi:uncharacterized protein YndB with AHSA1/START domain